MRFLLPLTLLSLALAYSATAATPSTYLVNGKQVTPEAALQAAMRELNVLQCKPVVAKLSKSGNSIHLAVKKTAKSAD